MELNVSLWNSSLIRTTQIFTSMTSLEQQYSLSKQDSITEIFLMRMLREYNREALKLRNHAVDILHIDSINYSSKWREEQRQFADAENKAIRILSNSSDLNKLRFYTIHRMRFVTDTMGRWIPSINQYWKETRNASNEAQNNTWIFYLIGSILLGANFVLRYLIIEENL